MSVEDDSNALRLAQAAADAQHRERARLAKILHDSVGGALSGVAIELDLLALDSPELKPRLDQIGQTLEKAFQQVRDLTYEIIPDLVPRLGLEAALRHLAARTGARMDVEDSGSALNAAQAEACYQICELALEEALRCGAGNLSLRLSDCELEIRHEATSGSPHEPSRVLALARMKVAALGAGLHFSSAADAAARCTITQVSSAQKGPGHAL